MGEAQQTVKSTSGNATMVVKPVGKINTMGGFSVERVSGEVMRKFIKSKDLKIDLDTTDEQVALALALHFREHIKPDNLVKCDYCFGESDKELPICPFCGVDEEQAKAAAKTSTAKPPVAAPAAANAAPKPAVASPPAAAQDVKSPTTAAKVSDKKSANADKTAPAKKNNEDGGAKNMATAAAKKDEKETKSNVTSITKAQKTGGKLTVAKLDESVAEVHRLKSLSAMSMWELGKKILEINTDSLWKLRVDENGKARYKGFDAFCFHELKMSPTHAYNLQSVAQEYTETQVKKFGPSKLGLVLQAPPEDREQIMENVEKGASKREIAEQVKKARKEKGFKKKTGKNKKATSSAKGHKTEKVTIASIEGRKTVKLYVKPASVRNLDFTQLKRAKKIGDVPFGRVEMGNGVVQYVSLQQDSHGDLIAVIETRREDAAE